MPDEPLRLFLSYGVRDASELAERLHRDLTARHYQIWQDIPVEVRREMVRNTSMFGRCWIFGRTRTLMDAFKCDAREIYNKNWDGCREVWKENYRRRKMAIYTDRPIDPPDPRLVEGERQYREREQAYQDDFNRKQQALYERWLAIRKARNGAPPGLGSSRAHGDLNS